MTRHGFHMVQPSPWPLVGSVGAFGLVMGFVSWFHTGKSVLVLMGLLLLVITMLGWWWDVVVEATFLGRHTSLVYRGLRVGMILFLLSEGFFFFTFFWSYIYYSQVMGQLWPPFRPLDPWGMPLLNTVVLVGSGLSVTWSQMELSRGNREEALKSLAITVALGFLFILLQVREFSMTRFAINDTVYGSVFFILTGFHGIHVIVGSVFLAVNWVRMYKHHFAPSHHFGFSAGNWYWHFVDVVWILLYLLVYCLGYHRYTKFLMCY